MQLIALSSNGDLRSAINTLQMLCSQTNAVVKNGKKRKRINGEVNGDEKRSGKGSRGGRGGKLAVSEDLRSV